MYIELKTERLLIRSMQVKDVETTYAYQGDKELTKYMMFLPDESIDATKDFIEGIEAEQQGENPRRFEMVIFLGDEHIGGISVYKENDNGEIVGELGWIMREEYQGNGYITEAARAVMEFTFKEIGLKKIIAHCDVRNKASIRVMEKLGMVLESKGIRTYSKTGEVAEEFKFFMKPRVKVIQTAEKEQEAWKKLPELELSENYNFRMNTVSVDSRRSYQTLIGFGGAFTEASAYTWANADEESKREIVEAYFDKEKGLAYNLGRTTIGGCDFSLEPYSYIEEGDKELKTFSIEREDKWLVPLLKEAENKAGHKLEILCSPWSPPAFMKDNNDINHGGSLLKKYYKLWARYMVKYIVEMKKRGIDMSMISVQNEPAANQIWASCEYNATEEAEFATDYLYAELKKEGLDEKVKIVIWDHNKDLIFRRMNESMSYPGAREIVWGVAYHWYVSDKSEILTMVHEKFPEKHLIFTEGCVELVNNSGETSSKEGIGAWKHGETYGRNIIKDFNNFNEAWIDWNILLNETGGPNYVGNFCEAPIIYDRNTNEVKYNCSYYYIGHFSRYVKQGAKRVSCLNDADKGIYSVAFQNPTGEIIIVVQNELDTKQEIALVIDNQGTNTEIPEHSITTFIVEK